MTTTTATMNIYLIGRHTPQGLAEEYNIVGQENVEFSLQKVARMEQIAAIVEHAKAAGADAIVFQNTPAILTASLIPLACSMSDEWTPLERVLGIKVGLIVSVPGDRTPNKSLRMQVDNKQDALIKEVVAFANSRARVIEHGDYWIEILVDTVPPFVFSHIEWL